MPSSSYQTAGNIVDAAIKDCKEASSSNLVTQCYRWINEAQELIILRKKRTWLDTTYNVQSVAPVERVCSVTNGSATVSYSAGSLPSASLQNFFKVNGFEEIYKVTNISGTVVTLEVPYLGTTSTAATGVIWQPYISVNSDIETIYQVYHQFQDQPLQELGPQEMRALQARDYANRDYPTHYSIFGDTSTGARVLWLYPAPHVAMTIYIDAKKYIPQLVASSDTPIIPIQHRQVLYHYLVYKIFSYHRNESKMAEALNNFNSILVQLDAEYKPTDDSAVFVFKYSRPKRRILTNRFFDKRLRD